MSEDRVGKLLERVGLNVASLNCQPNEVNMDYAGEVYTVLEASVGPLLRAGQRARLVCVNREVAQEYDAALTTLEGRE